jgi:hypothetical protein
MINKVGKITAWLHFFTTLLFQLFHFFNSTYNGPFYSGARVKMAILLVFRGEHCV